MPNAVYQIPCRENEPVKGYAHGSPEKQELKDALKEMAGRQIEIPLVIDGKEVRTGQVGDCVMPHDHRHVLGRYHQGGEKEVKAAITVSRTRGETSPIRFMILTAM